MNNYILYNFIYLFNPFRGILVFQYILPGVIYLSTEGGN